MKAVITRVAHAGHGEHRYFGHLVLKGLLGEETMTGLGAIAIMGRRLGPEERVVLDALAVCLTAADPRIWPLKAARLVASFGETLAGFAAGQLAMMGTYISPRVISSAAEQLSRLRSALAESSPEIKPVLEAHVAAFRPLAGYGVPLRPDDERLEGLRSFMKASGRAALAHWRAQEELSSWLQSSRDLAPNIAIGAAAALLDMGCSPKQAGALGTFLLEHVFMANAFESANQRDDSMQRIHEEWVEYVGPPRRPSPRAAHPNDRRGSGADNG